VLDGNHLVKESALLSCILVVKTDGISVISLVQVVMPLFQVLIGLLKLTKLLQHITRNDCKELVISIKTHGTVSYGPGCAQTG